MRTHLRRTLPFTVDRAASDGAEVEIVISSESVDRQGDVVVQAGGDWSGWWKTGAPVLWAHDSRGLPVAKGTRLWVEGPRTHARFVWVEGDAEAARVRNVFEQGLLAASIGFIVDAWTPLPDGPGARYTQWRGMEFSLVVVPANEDAIRVSRALGLAVVLADPDDDIVVLADDRPLAGSDESGSLPHAVSEARRWLAGFIGESTDARLDPLRRAVGAIDEYVASLTPGRALGDPVLTMRRSELTAAIADAVRPLASQVRAAGRRAQPRDDDPVVVLCDAPDDRLTIGDDDLATLPALIASTLRDVVGPVIQRETRRALNAARGRLD